MRSHGAGFSQTWAVVHIHLHVHIERAMARLAQTSERISVSQRSQLGRTCFWFGILHGAPGSTKFTPSRRTPVLEGCYV